MSFEESARTAMTSVTLVGGGQRRHSHDHDSNDDAESNDDMEIKHNEEEGSEEVSFSESADQDPAEADLLDPLDTAKEPSSVIEDESDEKITD